MPRSARIVVPGVPHHVTQRGNRRQRIFFSAKDAFTYLAFLDTYAKQHELAVNAYCLMPNHVHLIVTPIDEQSLSSVFGRVHQSYAQYVNLTYQLTGHLWQGRFHSTPLEESHLWAAVRYVERNPVRCLIATSPQHYRWSSAAAHCGVHKDALLTPLPQFNLDPVKWAEWITAADDERLLKRIRLSTATGQPLGSAAFVNRCRRNSTHL